MTVDPSLEEAIDAFTEAVERFGLAASIPRGADSSGSDIVLSDSTGLRMFVEIKRRSTITPADVVGPRSVPSGAESEQRTLVLVADRVTQSAQQLLRDIGVGWLDLRGHLRLAGPGLLIDADVPANRPRPERVDPFGGSAGLEVACWLLTHPFDAPGVRQVARELGRSVSTVSEVLKSLRKQQLVKADNSLLSPDLFWETASAWKSEVTAIASLPKPGEGPTNALLELGFDDVESTSGWAVADTTAAIAYGAPVAVTTGYPPDFYVQTPSIARRAVQFLGTAASWETRAATIRVAPVPAVCARRIDLATQHWPVVHPVFAALDLARDPARGREVLADWTPSEPWHRVW